MTDNAIADAELAEWERLAGEATAGSWGVADRAISPSSRPREAMARDGDAPRKQRNMPIVKVTECVGRFVDIDCGSMAIVDDVCRKWRTLDELVPNIAAIGGAQPDEGPRGRFRITVEFWPENAEEPPTP